MKLELVAQGRGFTGPQCCRATVSQDHRVAGLQGNRATGQQGNRATGSQDLRFVETLGLQGGWEVAAIEADDGDCVGQHAQRQ